MVEEIEDLKARFEDLSKLAVPQICNLHTSESGIGSLTSDTQTVASPVHDYNEPIQDLRNEINTLKTELRTLKKLGVSVVVLAILYRFIM